MPIRLSSCLKVSEDFICCGSCGESKLIETVESPVDEFMHFFNSVVQALHGRRIGRHGVAKDVVVLDI